VKELHLDDINLYRIEDFMKYYASYTRFFMLHGCDHRLHVRHLYFAQEFLAVELECALQLFSL